MAAVKMRRFFSIALIALAFFTGAASFAFAQTPPATPPATTEPAKTKIEQAKDVFMALPGAAQLSAKAGEKIATEFGEKIEEGFAYIMQKIMTLFAWLVGVAAITLDNAVYYTVVTMGDYVNGLSAVGVTWSILRDIGNIILIFGFLAAGIMIILSLDLYGYGQKMIPSLLAAAVFLNFSLFITEAVIDTTNLFATQFYTQINGGAAAGTKNLTFDDITNEGISSKIMSTLGLQTIYGDALKPNTEVFKAGNSWLIGFMGIILFMVTAFVMFSLAFVLIARFVILLFLIIISPIGFAGLAVPQLADSAKKWRDTLFEQAITAPVLLLLLYIALSVITDERFLTGLGSEKNYGGWVGFIQNGTNMNNLPGFASAVLSFIVAMGLLLAVVIVSKRLSAFGSAGATKLAGKLSFGATAFAGRRTVGRLSNYASRTIRSSRLGATTYGRALANVADKGAKASFDVRGIKAFSDIKNIDAGKAAEGGYRKTKEESIKAHEEYVKSVGAALDEKHVPAIADARLKREEADKASKDAITAANAEHNAAKKEAEPLINEVKRLEEIIKSKGKFDQERITAEKNLPAAKIKADSASAKVTTTENNAKNASASLTAAQTEEDKATKELSKAKREAAVAYGKSARTALTENPFAWAVTGTGGFAAGNKIIRDTLKQMSESEEAFDKLKKVIAAEAKAAEKSAKTSEQLNKAKENLTEKTEKETEIKP